MDCRRSKVRCACGAMPPATRLPSGVRPVSPAVNKSRDGLTLTPGMKPRPLSTGRSARISRRSMASSSERSVTIRDDRLAAPACQAEELLDLGLRLPLHEPGVNLLQELRVDHAFGRELLLDAVERVQEVHEFAHAARDLLVHLHRVDVERHDVAGQRLVRLHLAGDDLHARVAIVVQRVGGLPERAKDCLQRVGVLLEHLAARHHAGVHVQPIHLAFLPGDEAPVAGEVDLAARLLDALNTHGAQAAMASMSPLASAVTASGGERFTNWILAKSTPVSFAMAWIAIVTEAPLGIPILTFSRSLGERTSSWPFLPRTTCWV